MPTVSETARVTKRGADLNQTESLAGKALLVYQAIVADMTKPGEPDPVAMTHQGIPGFRWEKPMSKITSMLWGDRLYQPEPPTGKNLALQLNEYLRATGNAVCIQRGRGINPVWWIRGEWNGLPPAPPVHPMPNATYTERTLTKDEAGENRPAAPVTVTVMPALDAAIAANRGAAEDDTHADQRQRILDTAIAIYRHDGDLEVVKVSRALGYQSTNPVYAHFRTKNDLLIAVLAAVGAPESALSEADPRQCVRCGQVFTGAQYLKVHIAGHEMADLIVTTGVQLTKDANGELPMLQDVARAVPCAVTTVAQRVGNVDALHAAILRKIEDEKNTVPAPSSGLVTPVALARADRLAQYHVGLGDALGEPLNITAIRMVSIGIRTAQFEAFFDHLINDGLLVPHTGTGYRSNVSYYAPGPNFDPEIAAHIDLVRAALSGIRASVGLTAPVVAPPVAPAPQMPADLVAVLEMAIDQARLLQATADKPDHTEAYKATIEAERDRADQLQTQLDTIRNVFGQ